MEWHPPLHLGVVAIEKEAFVSPSTKVNNFTYMNIIGGHCPQECWYLNNLLDDGIICFNIFV